LWEAADSDLRPEETADAQEEEQARAEGERMERVGLGLRCDEISLSQASEIARQIASKLRVTPYKTEQGFAQAMRAAKLTSHRIYYGKTLREWIESDEPEMPIARTEEYTSTKAVEELFRMKAEARRKKDRERKAAKIKNAQEAHKKKSQKSSAAQRSRKAERQKNASEGRRRVKAERKSQKAELQKNP
jgi:Arc/MetJ family transcription regulator